MFRGLEPLLPRLTWRDDRLLGEWAKEFRLVILFAEQYSGEQVSVEEGHMKIGKRRVKFFPEMFEPPRGADWRQQVWPRTLMRALDPEYRGIGGLEVVVGERDLLPGDPLPQQTLFPDRWNQWLADPVPLPARVKVTVTVLFNVVDSDGKRAIFLTRF